MKSISCYCKSILICFLFSLVAPVWVCAQSAAHTLRGTVVDEQGEALAFVTIAVREAEGGKVLGGAVSDETGDFSVVVPQRGELYVETSMVGYLTNGAVVTLNPSGDTEIGKRVLSPDPNALAEVTVTARRNKLTRKIDRLVVDVEDNAAFAGRSSLALFSSAPGVFVQNGQISINGMPGTKIMVNGRLLNLSGDDLRNYLDNLKADDIKAIEIIAHPPAEYDAEGTGGIINIILKANREFGLTGRIGADYGIGLGKYPNYGPNAALDYKKGKVTASASYSYSRDKSFETYEQERLLARSGEYSARNESVDSSQNHRIRASMMYDINDRHFLGIDYTGRYGRNETAMVSNSDIFYPEAGQSIHSTGSFPSNRKTRYSNIGMNYVWTTDTLGSKFTVVGDFTNNDLAANSGTNSHTFDEGGQPLADTAFTFYFPSVAKIYTGELKYKKNFLSGIALSVGGKVSATDIDNKNSYDVFFQGAEHQGVNAFDYRYRERVYAGFTSLEGEFHGITYSVGVRGEQSDIRGDLMGSGQDTVIHANYFNLFPNVSLQKQMTDDGMHTLTLSYSKRISRPSYGQLNPYEYYLDNYSMASGNPYLRPQFRHGVELGYLLKQRYYVSLGYARIKDVINEVIESDPEREIMRSLRKNSGRYEVLSATFSVPVNIARWWTTTNNLIVDNKSSVAPEFDLNATSFVVQTEQNVTLPQNWSLNLSGYYTPRFLGGNFISGRVASVDFGVRKTLFDKRLQLNVNISDIFYTNNFAITSYYNQDRMKLRKKEQSRVLSLSVLYNFNIGKAFQTKRLEKSNADEQGRL